MFGKLKKLFGSNNQTEEERDEIQSVDADSLYVQAEEIHETNGFSAAVHLYTKAATLGNLRAMNAIGLAYLNGDGIAANREKARQWFMKAIDSGSVAGMYWMGLSYYNSSDGTFIDFKEWEKWMLSAAEQGDDDAQYLLGTVYSIEDESSYSEEKSEFYFEAAAKQGNISAMNSLGHYYLEKNNSAKALKWFTQASAENDTDAQYMLGLMYLYDESIPHDFLKAKHYLEMAAEAGNIEALKTLGSSYAFGNGITDTADNTKALFYLEQAATSGDAEAMHLAGKIYSSIGCYPDGKILDIEKCDLAKYWFQSAIDAGDTSAMSSLGWFYTNTYGDHTLAVYWLNKAAEYNDAFAMYALSILYADGLGVPKSMERSEWYYNKALELGFVEHT